MIPLCCPECKTVFKKNTVLTCESCGKQYTTQNGIPVFYPEKDAFYEGKFTITHYTYPRIVKKYAVLKPLFDLLTMISISNRPRRAFVTSGIPTKGEVLDLGCGGGTELFTRFGNVCGLDISLKSLECAAQVYPQLVQGNVMKLPFADSGFDTVIASHLIGHLVREEKELFLEEIKRVLKPGGYLVLFAETNADNKTLYFAKQSPELYSQAFIQAPGHLGLEYQPDLDKLIQSRGYDSIQQVKLYNAIWAVEHYVQKFPPEYLSHSALFKLWYNYCKWIAAYALLREIMNCILGIFARISLPFTAPAKVGEWLMVYRKKNHA